jgi:uncharacterized membrane protein
MTLKGQRCQALLAKRLSLGVSSTHALQSGLSKASGPYYPRTPREILDERFSKGEIDREEYEMRRKALIT